MLKLYAAPSVEPVTLTEAKAHLNVSTTDDDTLITSLIVAARQKCEQITRRALVTQTWDLFLDRFPTVIRVPLGQLQSITTLKYTDTDGTQQTWDSANYSVDTSSEPGRITPVYGTVWPVARSIPNTVEIRFVAGYGAAATVPDAVKAWIKLYIGNMYAHREQYLAGATVTEVPFVDGLLDDYRIVTF